MKKCFWDLLTFITNYLGIQLTSSCTELADKATIITIIKVCNKIAKAQTVVHPPLKPNPTQKYVSKQIMTIWNSNIFNLIVYAMDVNFDSFVNVWRQYMITAGQIVHEIVFRVDPEIVQRNWSTKNWPKMAKSWPTIDQKLSLKFPLKKHYVCNWKSK